MNLPVPTAPTCEDPKSAGRERMRAVERIVFCGNCQAAGLAKVYNDYFGVPLGQKAVYVDRFRPKETDSQLVAEAEAVVVQQFDFESDVKSGDLRPGTKRYAFPMVVGGFLWPFGSRAHPQNAGCPFMPAGPYPAQIGDTFLNKMIAEKVPHEDAIRRYIELDFTTRTNLDRLYELHIDGQRRRDGQTGYDLAGVIERHFRDEALFLTPDHPGLRVFAALASPLFEQMGIAPAAIKDALDSLVRTPFPLDETPIHPTVASHFGLRFVDATTRFRFHDEGFFTFEEFARRYLDYQWNPELAEGIATALELAPARALALLEAGLAKSPGSAHGWRVKAAVLARLNRHAEARAAVASALALEPRDPDNLEAMAVARLRERDAAGAEADARRLIALFPRYAPGHRAMTNALFHLGRATEAVAAAREAVRLLPSDAHSYAVLGRMLLRQNDLAGAEAAARKATALAPDIADFHQVLARVLGRLDRVTEAVVAVREAVRLLPSDPHSYALLGNLLLRQNDLAGAEAAVRRAIALGPQITDFQQILARVLGRTGRRDESRAAMRSPIDETAPAPVSP